MQPYRYVYKYTLFCKKYLSTQLLKELSFREYFFAIFLNLFLKNVFTIKIINICCLNVGSKMRLKLGPPCNTLTANSNLKTLYRGFIVVCPCSPLVATLLQARNTPRKSISSTPSKRFGKRHWREVRKEHVLVILCCIGYGYRK